MTSFTCTAEFDRDQRRLKVKGQSTEQVNSLHQLIYRKGSKGNEDEHRRKCSEPLSQNDLWLIGLCCFHDNHQPISRPYPVTLICWY